MTVPSKAAAKLPSVLGALVGLGWLAGAPWPLAWGWMPAIATALVVAVIAARRAGCAPLGGWEAALRPRRPAVLGALVFATGFVAVVLGAVLLCALGELLVAFPAAIAPTIVAVLAIAFASQLSRWLRWAIAPLVVGLAIVAGRFEAEGEHAGGGAWSGPVLGIHPFQTTAVIIDGFGPFDLPINDFVEPAGGRGYDPPAYAAAVERALHRIAEVHFARGPLRAHQAFAQAKVEYLETPPIRERLDRELPESVAGAPAARIAVHSGTKGQRSRVEFVCPGRRDDPHGTSPESVMSRSCPTKYAPEASAGLGLTGRWPGYAQWRGNERIGLVRLAGGTRRWDDENATSRAREAWATGALVLVAVIVVVVARARRRASVDLGPALGLVLPLLGLVVLVALTREAGSIAAVEQGPAWRSLATDAAWAGAIWIGLGTLVAWWVPQRGGSVDARVWPWLGVALLVVAASADLPAAQWLSPTAVSGESRFAGAVTQLADRVGVALSLVPGAAAEAPPVRSEIVDAITASAIATALVAAAFALVGAVARVGAALPGGARRVAPWLALLAGVLAVALAVSRKTDGGIALIPAATGVALVLGSALRRVAARGPWPRDRVHLRANVLHLSWLAAGAAALLPTLAAAGRDPVLWLYAAFAIVALVSPLAVCLADRPSPGATTARGAGPRASEPGPSNAGR